MKKIFKAFVIFLGALFSAQAITAQQIDFTLKYNHTASKYEVYGRATAPLTIITGGSRVSVVLPASAINAALTITSVKGGLWSDESQTYAPSTQPMNDFHSISTVGSSVTFPNSTTEVLLFTFTHSPCIEGARMFNNATDPGPVAMAGLDYLNYVEHSFTGIEYTGVPYDNFGTVCTTLPIILTSFTGKYHGSQTDLTWTTSSEVNASHFEIERSEDGRSFSKIGQVDVKEKIAGGYNYTDNLKNISGNMVYYRLRMVDKDSKSLYSHVINFKLQETKSSISIYPNPVVKGETIYLQSGLFQDYKKVSADIVDMHGKIIHHITATELQSKAISTNTISAGIYFIRFSINGESSIQKFVVQ